MEETKQYVKVRTATTTGYTDITGLGCKVSVGDIVTVLEYNGFKFEYAIVEDITTENYPAAFLFGEYIGRF